MKTVLTLRRVAAFCILLGFLFLFTSWDAPLSDAGFLARFQAGPALLAGSAFVLICLALVTFLFGRLYCSLLCPLGLVQDGLLRLRKKQVFHHLATLKWLRFGLLAIFALALVTGILLPFTLLDPYSAFGRIAAGLFAPLLTWMHNGVVWVGQNLYGFQLAESAAKFPGWPAMLVALVTFTLLVFLAIRYGRAWCNFCPVGTALGFFASRSPFRIRIDPARCISCGKCERACKTGCIDLETHKIDNSRCVTCFRCPTVCPRDALSYGLANMSTGKKESRPMPKSARRAFLRSAIGGVVLGALAAREAPAAEIDKLNRPDVVPVRRGLRERVQPLTPPGSAGFEHFAQHCIGCQLCVEACPNRVLVTSLSGPGLMQPGMSYEAGYCRPNCARCGEVCPAGAISPFTLAEKKSIQIGVAKTDLARCIVHVDQVQCTACQRICPNQAITLVPVQGSRPELKRPQVEEQKCTGCGACEYICPATPLAAIAVAANGEHRHI